MNLETEMSEMSETTELTEIIKLSYAMERLVNGGCCLPNNFVTFDNNKIDDVWKNK